MKPLLRQIDEDEYSRAYASCLKVDWLREFPAPDLSTKLVDPLGRRGAADIILSPPAGTPEAGEICVELVPGAEKLARLCRDLCCNGGFWRLGPNTEREQVLLALRGRHPSTIEQLNACCPLSTTDAVRSALESHIEGGLVEEKSRGFQLTNLGLTRRAVLDIEWRAIATPAVDVGESLHCPPRETCARLLHDLSEHDFTTRVVVPLLQSLGFFGVTYNNGPLEKGKDVFACRLDELGKPMWLAVVVKAKRLTDSSSANEGVSTVLNQVRQSYARPLPDVSIGRRQHISRCWVVTSRGATPHAQGALVEQIESEPLFRTNTRVILGAVLIDHICAHAPWIWTELQSR